MANILSYLKWRGDISLESSPFNEVDNLLLSELIYINFSDIVGGLETEQKTTIEEAYEKYKVLKNVKRSLILSDDELLFEMMSKSKRFSQAMLSHYVDILDDTRKMTQFAAIKIEFSSNLTYICFRGTDDTLIGWKEDFSFGYEVSHAEKLAFAYLKSNIEESRTYYIGGHSKGGHLAVYAALMCEENLQEKIERIYSNDGPGICFDIISKMKYHKIAGKIIKFVPQFSIVGMLYEESKSVIIIESHGKGIMQHNIFTWNVESVNIIKKRKLNKKSKECLHIINGFLDDSSLNQKKIFVESLFHSLSDKGFKTLTDIANQGVDAFLIILESVSYSSKKSDHMISKLLKRIFSRLKIINYVQLFKTRKFYISILVFITGVLFVATPQHALRVIGTFLLIGLLLFSLYQLYKMLKQKKKHQIINQTKLYLYSITILLTCICILYGKIILVSSHLVLGGLFCWYGYHQAKIMVHSKLCHKRLWILYLIDSILVCILGIVAFSTTTNTEIAYMLSSGTYLVVRGMIEMGNILYLNESQKINHIKGLF